MLPSPPSPGPCLVPPSNISLLEYSPSHYHQDCGPLAATRTTGACAGGVSGWNPNDGERWSLCAANGTAANGTIAERVWAIYDLGAVVSLERAELALLQRELMGGAWKLDACGGPTSAACPSVATATCAASPADGVSTCPVGASSRYWRARFP